MILEKATFKTEIARGNLNPFKQESVIICSFQFARASEPYIRQTEWDLIVIDEAHRLRNVYKNTSKIAQAIKQAVAPFHKVLLTATPLQNSLLELFGLVSIIDEFTFGDLQSFRSQFTRLTGDAEFAELKQRLLPICKRTLRKQVLEYVRYTNRHALVQEFVPTQEEQRLYDLVSEYLQRPNLYALPSSQRQLMTLILRKLLASSTYAISDTLEGLAAKLDTAAKASESIQTPPETLAENFEQLPELEDEWSEDDEDSESADGESSAKKALSPEDLQALRQETALLREFHSLAKSITKNSKGEVLLTALRRGFAAAAEAQKKQGAATLQQKALIFTESRRTQEYLYRILEQTEFAGKVVLSGELPPGAKPIHHSDRGSQYCCHEYVSRLMDRGLSISMTESNHCAENALAERMNGILKSEYGLGREFRCKQSARLAVDQAVSLYNTRRPHTALGYQTPQAVHSLAA